MNTRSIGITGLRVSSPGEVAAEPRRLAQKGALGYRRLPRHWSGRASSEVANLRRGERAAQFDR